MSNDIHSAPMDEVSVAALAERGLRFDFVRADSDEFVPWFQAMGRGFLNGRMALDEIETRREPFGHRRITAVWDDTGADAATPVGTASSWIADLTLPGERSIPSWAISTITVAPTHRRRGIARQLLESELRVAASLDVPVAMLTASEATIYSRFGFAPSAMRADWKVDLQRAKWIGPTPAGRVQLVPTELVRDGGGFELLERVRLRTPGQIYFDRLLWTRLFGLKGMTDPDQVRVVRYDDESGEPQGFASYKIEESDHTARAIVLYLVAATDDAYAALWKYFFEMDLVTSVEADLRPIDEPFAWQISDYRAARKHEEGDHLWTRILDVPRALEARSYSAPGVFVLSIDDALGYAAGTFLLEIDSAGKGSVATLDSVAAAAYADNHALALSAVDLAAIYLGGTSVSTLARAGRIRELTAGSAAAADASFRSGVAPWLSIWF